MSFGDSLPALRVVRVLEKLRLERELPAQIIHRPRNVIYLEGTGPVDLGEQYHPALHYPKSADGERLHRKLPWKIPRGDCKVHCLFVDRFAKAEDSGHATRAPLIVPVAME